MTLPDGARVWVARITALEEPIIRAHALANDLGRLPPGTAVAMLADIQQALAQGDQVAASFMLGVQDMLTQDLLTYALRAALYKAAAACGLTSVQRLILSPPAAQQGRPRVRGKAPEGNDTLGMRTWKARTAPPNALDRFTRDADARVVRALLLNPRLTEKDVLKVATRRPVTRDVLDEIARSPRWNRRESVKRALVFNPYAPVEVALGFLPFIHRADLLHLAADPRVHPEVCRQAAQFAAWRPPVREGEEAATVFPPVANEDEEGGEQEPADA